MKLLLIVVLAIAVAACSSNDAIELEPVELVKFKPTIKLKKLWSKSVGSGQDVRYPRLIPALTDSYVIAAGSEGDVVAFDRVSGKKAWDTELKLDIAGGVGANAQQVLVGTYKGDVISLDTNNGEEQWRVSVSSEVLAAPQTNGSIVVVQTLDGRLYGLDAATGEQRWMFDNTLPVLTLRGTSTPLMSGNTVFAGFSTGKVLALSANDGLILWEQRVAIPQGRTELERVIDVDSSPLLAGDILYVAGYQGRIVAINRGTGRPIWAENASTHQNISSAANQVFMSTTDGLVQAYSVGNGEITWENNQLIRRNLSAPQTFGSYLAVGDFEGYLHVIDQRSGEFLARTKIDSSGIRSPMVSADGVLYVLADNGDLVAVKVVE